MLQTPSSLARSSSRSRDQGGFTLIEVLVTALIVGLIASATATALVSATHTSADQRMRSQADALATQDQERLRGLSDAQLSALDGSASQTHPARVRVAGQSIDFTVTSTASYQAVGARASCTSGAAAYFRITSTVTWSENGGGRSPSVSEESLLSRPATGQLPTLAQDQTGAPLGGVTVTAAGPTTRQGQTDVNGCAVFAGLPAGAYTVDVARPGYVYADGKAAHPGNATLHDTDTSVVPTTGNTFTLGQAGALKAAFTTLGGAGAEADGVSWQGASDTQAHAVGASAPQTSLTTPTTLFPFVATSPSTSYANNYAAWGGRCPGQEPRDTGKPGEPVAPSYVSVPPGATATGSGQPVVEPLLNLSSFSATVGGTTYSAPSDVVLRFDSDGCSDTWRATVVPGAGAPSANGWLANPGQPYAPAGTLTVCADYRARGGAVRGTVTTGNARTDAPNVVPPIVASESGAC